MTQTEPRVEAKLEFRLLGPVEVSHGGEPLKLGGERQRALLALLLLHANEVVSTDRLVDSLFGEDAGPTSVNALQAAVSRLRRVLENGGTPDAELVTSLGGYSLQVPPDQIDASSFERLLADGRVALSAGDPATAAATLQRALALWRGPPLADLGGLDFAQNEIRRLEELRLNGQLDRIEAELELGQAAGLVPELEQLAAANPLQERPRGQLMLALYRAGRQAEALDVYRRTRELLSEELGLEPSRSLQQLERAILLQDEALDPDPLPTPTMKNSAEAHLCPFKGLASFDVADAAFFFGRERIVDDLVARAVESRLVGIVGPSGCGKSSILRAGLVASLAAGVLPGSERWRVCLIRPGAHPAAELERALGESEHDDVIVAVDQLEEAFTVCESEGERAAFFDGLAAAALDPGGRVHVAVALRGDFYGRCAAYASFSDLLSRNHALVGLMNRAEIRRAIEAPAARAQLVLDDGLADAIVDDVIDEPGGLPLLSTALLQLWRFRDGNALRLESYRASGGVHRAVARLAEDAFGRLGRVEQLTTRQIMLRLAAGDGAAAVRVPVPRAELAQREGAERVLAVLADARLITVGDGAVEVAHEALLREWPRLRAWLEESNDERRVQRHLAASAREWEERGRDQAELYRGARLAAALDWAAEHPHEAGAPEVDFLAAARAAAESELRAQRRLNRRLKASLAGAAVLLLLAIAAGVVALAKRSTARHEASVALGRQLGAEAVTAPRIDLAMLLARESLNLDNSRQTQGTLLATLLRSPALTGTFTVPITDRPQAVEVSPDNRTIAVATNNNVMRFYDTRTHRQTLTARLTQFPYTYIPGTDNLLAAPPGSTPVELIDTRTARVLAKFPFGALWNTNPTSFADPLLASADGKHVYFLFSLLKRDGSDGQAYIERWLTASGGAPLIRPLHLHGMFDAALTGDGKLAIATDDGLSLWNASTLTRIRGPRGPKVNSAVQNGAVSHNGRFFAYGLRDGTVHFFDADTGRTIAGSAAHAADVQHVGFTPNSRLAVSTGDDGTVIVWDPATGRPVERLPGHAGRVLGLAFTSDSRTAYTASLDGTVLQWDLAGTRRFGDPFSVGETALSYGPAQSQVPPLAVSQAGRLFSARSSLSTAGVYSTADGRRLGTIRLGRNRVVGAEAWAASKLVVGDDRGDVDVWSVDGRPRLAGRLHGLTGFVRSVATSDGGRLVAAVDGYSGKPPAEGGPPPEKGSLALWHDGTLVTGHGIALNTFGNSVAFSPDGTLLAVATDDGQIHILDTSTERVLRTIKPQTGSIVVTFAPDGTLASGSWSGIVSLWNPRTGQAIAHPVLTEAAPVASIAFNPSGDTFATVGGSSGSPRLWTTATLQQLGSDLPGGQGRWGNAAFTRDGRSLLVVFDDGTADRWPVTVAAWEEQACKVAGRSLTREEWARFVRGHAYSATCPAG